MNEQTLKELGIELKKLELKEDDVLVVEYDMNKIKPQMMGTSLQIITNSIDNKVISYPKGMNIKNIGTENLIRIRNRFNEYVDKILKGEE